MSAAAVSGYWFRYLPMYTGPVAAVLQPGRDRRLLDPEPVRRFEPAVQRTVALHPGVVCVLSSENRRPRRTAQRVADEVVAERHALVGEQISERSACTPSRRRRGRPSTRTRCSDARDSSGPHGPAERSRTTPSTTTSATRSATTRAADRSRDIGGARYPQHEPNGGQAHAVELEGSTRRQLLCGLRPARGAPMAATDTTASDASERQVHLRTCPLCEAMCGLEIHVAGRPGRAHPRRPRRRVERRATSARRARRSATCTTTPTGSAHRWSVDGDTWREVELGRGVRRAAPSCSLPVIAEHGIEAVTAYVGNPLAHTFSLEPLRRHPHRHVGHPDDLLAGHRRPVAEERQQPPHVRRHVERSRCPTSARTDLLVVMGANPHASQGSLLACPDVMGEIDGDPGARRQGHRRSTPRRTGTADQRRRVAADHARHRRRVPARGRARAVRRGPRRPRSRSPTSIDGVDELARARRRLDARAGRGRRPASPPSASAGSRASCADDRARRRSTAASGCATRSSARSPAGSSTSSTSSPATSTSTGRADVPATRGVVGHRAADARASRTARRTSAGGSSRVRGAPEVLGQVPVSCLAEEIATPGDGPDPRADHRRGQPGAVDARAATASTRRCDGLDCMISVDIWLNETTRHADVILPGPVAARAAAPRRPDLAVRGRQRRQLLGAGLPARPTAGPQEWEILIRLAGLCLGQPAEDVDVAAIDDGFFDVHGVDRRASTAPSSASTTTDGGPERILDLTLRTGPFGDRYGENPDGLRSTS